MAQSPSQKQSYYVGIICALATEKAAMEAMLDEEHPKMRRAPGDDNDYTFGRIHDHNVAIACLPAGVTGTVSAATVARDMMRSFPIKIGLMVGIAGGVPSKSRDIRLGDVVVSQPTDMHGGVVQWDFGKMERGGAFRRTGTLNKPPRVLLGVLQTLQAVEMRKGTKIPELMLQMIDRNPRMKKKFSFQGSENDQLFEADYPHGNGPDCSTCRTDRTLKREPRDDDEPAIHYGNIASGDEVMKDGPTRDRIAKEENIICFEMEAAGLSDSFPCLVIRGICDYADSHKNKRWQPYAAVTAAAYAKWLLNELELSGIEELPTASSSKYNVPFSLDGVPSNTHFVGREDEISRMEQCLQPLETEKKRRTVFVIYGMGGMGKTQLAVQYARVHRTHYSAVIWVNGNSKAQLHESLLSFISRIPTEQLPPSLAAAVSPNAQEVSEDESVADVKYEVVEREFQRWLSQTGNSHWLMIVDNVDTEKEHPFSVELAFPRVLQMFPPGDNGSILITTRLVELKAKFQRGIKLTQMNNTDAKAILQQKLSEQDSEALVGTLAGLPLALAQASAYIEQTGITTATYLDLYEKKWLPWMEMQTKFPLEDYGERSVLTTWNMSYNQVLEQSENAASLMRLWAFLDCNDIRHDLLKSATNLNKYSALPSWIRSLAENDLAFVEAIGMLYKFSLVDARHNSGRDPGYAMHTVLHNWCLHLSNDDDRQEMCWLAVRIVGASVPKGRSSYRSADRLLLPHILQIYRRIEQNGYRPRTGHELSATLSIIGVLARQDRLIEARKLANTVLEEALKTFGDSKSVTLSAYHHMGWIETELGNFAAATAMYQSALTGKIELYGSHDHSTLKTIRNLGHLLMKQEKYAEAVELYQKAVPSSTAGYRKVSLHDFSSTAHCDILDSYGSACMATGLSTQARVAFRTALEAKELLLGSDHLSTLDTVRNYALLEHSKRNIDLAEQLLRSCLRGQERSELLGPSHVDTATTMRDLGNVLLSQGQEYEAERLFRRALAIREKAYGAFHQRTIDVQLDLRSVELVSLHYQDHLLVVPPPSASSSLSMKAIVDRPSSRARRSDGPIIRSDHDNASLQPSGHASRRNTPHAGQHFPPSRIDQGSWAKLKCNHQDDATHPSSHYELQQHPADDEGTNGIPPSLAAALGLLTVKQPIDIKRDSTSSTGRKSGHPDPLPCPPKPFLKERNGIITHASMTRPANRPRKDASSRSTFVLPNAWKRRKSGKPRSKVHTSATSTRSSAKFMVSTTSSRLRSNGSGQPLAERGAESPSAR